MCALADTDDPEMECKDTRALHRYHVWKSRLAEKNTGALSQVFVVTHIFVFARRRGPVCEHRFRGLSARRTGKQPDVPGGGRAPAPLLRGRRDLTLAATTKRRGSVPGARVRSQHRYGERHSLL